MSNNEQSSSQIQKRNWAALWSVLLLAPLAMAPKGCDSAVVGDNDCGKNETGWPQQCGPAAGSSNMGAAGNAGSVSVGTGGGTVIGTAGAPGDDVCGGQLVRACASGQYCLYDVKTAACGSGDQTGVCTSRPQVCPDIYAPVCACDSKTYASECEAAAKGFSVLHTGACEDPSSGVTCGGLKPATCAKSEFCKFADTVCGAADQTGTCTRIPEACDQVFAPVCGCDNISYSNSCTAAAAGVSVLHSGECGLQACGGIAGLKCPADTYCIYPLEAKCGANDATGYCQPEVPADAPLPSTGGTCTSDGNPVCGCDGKTYSDSCAASSARVSLASLGACGSTPTGATCGGLIGATCPKGQACIFPVGAKCGAADMTGTCQSTGGGCPKNIDLQCGCDGKTYDNTCVANAAGVSVVSAGACGTTQTTCGGKLGGKCADNEYCDFPPSANCGKADATGTCTAKLTGACTQIYDPVCGCDGKTYGNTCETLLAGVSIASDGACATTGKSCGGELALTCADGEYCNYKDSGDCGKADGVGKCAKCSTLNPVCGCDGKTYSNSCEAGLASAWVAADGACP